MRILPPKLEYVPTVADRALQENIRILFSPNNNTNNNMTELITSALVVIVAKTDEFMTESQKRQVDIASNNLNAAQSKLLVRYYPCLMALIKALLIHCQNMAIQMESTEKGQENSINKCVLDAWQQIMGELHDLHAIILYASKKSLIDLGDYPMEWQQTIQSMNTEINRLRTLILSLNDDLNLELSHLNERDKKIQLILSQYSEVDTRVQVIKARKNSLFISLNGYTFVPEIVHVGITRFQALFPSH